MFFNRKRKEKFNWNDVQEVLGEIKSEIDELKENEERKKFRKLCEEFIKKVEREEANNGIL